MANHESLQSFVAPVAMGIDRITKGPGQSLSEGGMNTVKTLPVARQDQYRLIYEMEGVEGVIDSACADGIPFRLCSRCECETPTLQDGCLCCGVAQA